MTKRIRLPFLGYDNQAFWTGGQNGRLLIHRCGECDHYIHPPMPICELCRSRDVAPQAVSGRGVLHSFTINYQSWFPGNEVPFIFAAVELVEQERLFLFSNVVGISMDEVVIGMPLYVLFEHHEDVWLPVFAPERVA